MVTEGYLVPKACQIEGSTLLELYYEHFGYRNFGTFAEIGAFDGNTYGFTYGLAYAGWRGLYVEAVPEFAEQCRKNHAHRPGIRVENIAVLDREGETDLYMCGECSSTKLTKISKDWGCTERQAVTVPCTTLNKLYQKHAWPRKYDLLVVDVEEAEIEVLKSHDLNLWSPKMCIIETHGLTTDSRYLDDNGVNVIAKWCDKFFVDRFGYKKVYEDLINTIYVRNNA